ncbi:MAG: Holliday junction resolvase RuvX [Phycisphaerales bacterium]|nr:Holliday junction resolvase RuvX [Phycisphaerales bacterium]
MRIFAIDLGDQRTGLALADRITGIASPAGLIETPIDRENGRLLIDAIVKQFHQQASGPETEIVIGIPLNMDSTEGPRAKLVREFTRKLASRIDRPIVLVDERKTSQLADARMSQSGLTHKQKKQRRDAIAAAAIAQLYLDEPDTSVIDTVNPVEHI